jgi:hypothetical protein
LQTKISLYTSSEASESCTSWFIGLAWRIALKDCRTRAVGCWCILPGQSNSSGTTGLSCPCVAQRKKSSLETRYCICFGNLVIYNPNAIYSPVGPWSMILHVIVVRLCDVAVPESGNGVIALMATEKEKSGSKIGEDFVTDLMIV